MTRARLTLLFTVTFVVSPAFTEPFSGFREDQLPIPQIDPPIQPAGYAFAIWGLIYGWLIVSAGFGLWKRANNPTWDRMRTPLILSLALGTPWLWVANQSAVWATVLIIAMAVFAIWACFRAPQQDRGWAIAPVSIYAGWLTAASLVSLGTTAAGFGIGMDGTGWAIACLILAALIGTTVQSALGWVPGYGLTIIWALTGIIVANGTGGWIGWLAMTAIAALGLTLLRVAPFFGSKILK